MAAAAPLIWALSDLIITGNPLHSFTGTRDTAAELGRVTGLDDVPLTMPRRLGEILREPVLVGAAGGGLIALAWRRSRALLPAIVGVVAVGAFCVLAGAGLPILTRYLLLPAVMLAIFCGAGALGWLQLVRGDRRRRPWAAFGAVVGVLLIVFAPAQVRRLDRLQAALATQGRILADLRGLTVPLRGRGVAELRAGCGPLTVPNQRAVPHLALALALSPRDIRNAQERPPLSGVYLVPSSPRVARQFVLNRIDERRAVVPVPPGFRQSGSSGAWRVYRKAESPLGLRPPNC